MHTLCTNSTYLVHTIAFTDKQRTYIVHEVNPRLWLFGRKKPLLGSVTVEETADRQLAKDVDRKKRAAETRSLMEN